QGALGGNFLSAGWEDVAAALQVSTYSLKALAMAALPLMDGGGSIVGLDFDASVAWPGYDWMGVAKAGLEACARYLARELGGRRASPIGDDGTWLLLQPHQTSIGHGRSGLDQRRCGPGLSVWCRWHMAVVTTTPIFHRSWAGRARSRPGRAGSRAGQLEHGR